MDDSPAAKPPQFLAVALSGLPEIAPGDDLAVLIRHALTEQGIALADGDILVVTSKIVSKAEGRIVAAADREDAITLETVRVVASRAHPGGVTRIVENRQGIVQAAAGVDASNTADGTVLLLPENPDASARSLCTALRQASGARVGVIVSDTLGRPWREGQVDAAIGAAGVRVIDDLRGSVDSFGNRLAVTQAAVGDELAAATDLVKGKASGMPVALVRGLGHLVDDSLDTPARSLVRPPENDMFRLGTDEAIAQGIAMGLAQAREQAGRGDTAASPSAPAFRSLAFRDIPQPDYADAIVAPLPCGASTDPEVWARTLFSPAGMPPTAAALLGLRQAVAGVTARPRARGAYAIDAACAIDVVEGEEALVSADDAHLDVRCAVGVDPESRLVRVTTVVRLKNLRGRLYFAPVRLAHPILATAMLRRARRALRGTWYS